MSFRESQMIFQQSQQKFNIDANHEHYLEMVQVPQRFSRNLKVTSATPKQFTGVNIWRAI